MDVDDIIEKLRDHLYNNKDLSKRWYDIFYTEPYEYKNRSVFLHKTNLEKFKSMDPVNYAALEYRCANLNITMDELAKMEILKVILCILIDKWIEKFKTSKFFIDYKFDPKTDVTFNMPFGGVIILKIDLHSATNKNAEPIKLEIDIDCIKSVNNFNSIKDILVDIVVTTSVDRYFRTVTLDNFTPKAISGMNIVVF